MRITLVGPTAPLRGGIVAHMEGARVALLHGSHSVDVRGFSRLYPRWIGGDRPGSGGGARSAPGAIDALAPRSWREVGAGIFADVLAVEYWTPLVAPALRSILASSNARRRVLICHNARPHEPIAGARMLLESLLRRVDGVIAHSDTVLAALGRLPSAKLATAVVPMPLLSAATGVPRCPVELAHDAENGTELVVLVGHLRRYKGIDVLARAWHELGHESRRARLVVAGEPIGVRRELEALERSGGNVTIVPRYLDDAELRWLLANAAAVVLPYTAASQSGVLPLALRLARHVVVSDAGGLRGQCDGALAPASWVPAGDATALARAIERQLPYQPGRPGSALRHARADLAANEVEMSWQPFVAAVEAIACGAGAGCGHSNRRRAGPSVKAERVGDEAPRQAWYDAAPSAGPVAEIQRR